MHADLGEMDWPETMPTVERHARAYDIRLEVVRREKGNLLDQVRARGMWPGPKTRFCTSDQKTGPSNKRLTRLVAEVNEKRLVPKGRVLAKLGIRPARVLNVFGMRAGESSERKQRLVFERQKRESSGNRTVDRWLPIHDWTLQDVWDRIDRSGIDPHPVYASVGVSRSSCSFCVLASRRDLLLAANARPQLAQVYAATERETGHLFKANLSMQRIIEEAAQIQ